MSTREIQGHLRDLYGIDVSPDLISAVTDAVLEEVTEWQNRRISLTKCSASRTYASISGELLLA